jgi:putative transposase
LNMLRYKRFYRRHLPHFQPPGATLFVTYRLAGSVPRCVAERLSQEAKRRQRVLDSIGDPEERRRWCYIELNRLFGKWDAVLDGAEAGPSWLGSPKVARLVAEALHSRDGREYDLVAFCIMPNHVHVVFAPLCRVDGSYHSLSSIMRSLKGRTARQANLVPGRRGAFWQHENYDHVVRDEAELSRIITYVLENHVKAGLASSHDEWEWGYSKFALRRRPQRDARYRMHS